MTDLHQYDGPAGDTGNSTTQAAKDEATNVASTAVDQGKQTASVAAEAAGQTAATATEGAKQVASEAAAQVTEVTRQATDQARELVSQAQSQLHEQATSQTDRAAGNLFDFGRQLRALGDGQPDEAGFAADAARQLAGKVEEIADRVQQKGFDGVVDDLRSFARRRPGAFLASAVATGFVVGRLGRGAQVAQSDGESDTATTPAPAHLPAMATPTLPEPAAVAAPQPYLPPATVPDYDGGS
ncbi:MAG TPA: hypothetical protein VMZ73_04925 [Acidimicrobiales bacterium]|nr:hypothetical protein [Acidimicrobiales bacterium]